MTAGKLRLLYVDDEKQLLEICKIFLELEGEFIVDTIDSAPAALELLNSNRYDAIISDYQMPVMDGIGFLKEVRGSGKTTPFILFTGRGREEVVIEAINNGADFYLQKGGDPRAQFAELTHKVQQAIRGRQSENLLRDSERRLSDIIDFLPDATFAIDRTGHVIAWNRAIEDMTGVSSEEIMGKGDFEYAIPFYGERRPILIDLIDAPDEKITQYYSDIKRIGNSLIGESDLPHPKGHQVSVLAKACLLYNQQGDVTGAIESIKDITELKKTEQELRKSEERYHSIVNDQTEMIERFTPDGTITFVNEAFRSYFMPRFGLDEIEGRDISEIPQLGEHDELKGFLSSLTLTEPIKELEKKAVGRDGKTYWQQWSVRALFDQDGEIAEYQVVGRDITDKRLAEDELISIYEEIAASEEELREQYEELALSEERFRGLFEKSHDPLLLFAESGCIDCNAKALELFGYTSRDEIVGHRIADLSAPRQPDGEDSGEAGAVHRRTAIEKGGDHFEWLYRRKNGGTFIADTLLSSFKLDGKQVVMSSIRDITERKRAEEAIRESEEKFRSLYDNMTEGAALHKLIYDENGVPVDYIIIDTNPAYEKQLGISRESVIGKTSTEVYGVEKPPELEIYSRVALTGEPEVFEAYYPHKETYFIISAFCPAKGRFATIFNDITERKNVEEAIRESEAKYRDLAELLPQMIFELDTEFNITYANRHALEVLGFTQKEIEEGINALTFLEPSQHETVRKNVRKQLKDRDVRPNEYIAIRKDGSTFPVIIYASPIYEDNTLLGFRGVIVDITERKKMEDEIRESEEKFRTIVETSPDMIWESDMQGRFRYISPMILPIMGYTPEEVIHKSVFDLVPERERSTTMEAWKKAISSEESPSRIEVTGKHRNGNELIIEIRPCLLDRDGTQKGFRGVAVDITERKRAEDELRKSEKKFRTLVDHSLEGIVITDFSGKILFMNHAAGQMIDLPDYTENIEKRNVLDYIAPESREDVIQDLESVSAGIDAYLVNYRLITESQKTIWVECIGKKIVFMGADAMLVSMRDVTAKKEMEELRESEKKFATIFRESPVALTIVSVKDGTFVDVNESFLASTGYSREEVIGKNSESLGIFADKNEYANMVVSLRERHTVVGMEMKCLTRSGKLRICLFSSSLVRIGDEQHFLTVVKDITERKRAEKSLMDSQKNLRNVFDNLPDLVLVHRGGIIHYVNPAMAESMGIRSEDIQKKSIIDFIPPEYHARVSSAISERVRAREDQPYEIEITSQTGRRRAVLIKGTQIEFDGSPATLTVLTDITELRITEKTLRESEKQLALAIEGSGVGLWDWYVQTGKTIFNERWAEIIGYTLAEISPVSIDTWAGLLHPDDLPRVEERLKRHFSKKSSAYECEARMRHKNGDWIWVLDRGKVFEWDQDGRPVRMAGTHLDITDRKRTEEALRSANRQLKLLSGITRHDVLNKITAILGYLIIADKKGIDPELHEYLKEIETATTDIRNQIQFTRIYQDLGTDEPQWIELDTILPGRDLPESIKLRNEVHGIYLHADPMLEKVFFNLFDNSIRHGERVTEISLSCRQSGEKLILVWEDNGVGIVDEDKERIFERGYGKNTGLGMFLVREILSLTGMTIMETGVAGKGARFEIMVPGGVYSLSEEQA